MLCLCGDLVGFICVCVCVHVFVLDVSKARACLNGAMEELTEGAGLFLGESQGEVSRESLEDRDVFSCPCMISAAQNSDRDHRRCDQPMLCFAWMRIAITICMF